MQKRVEMRPLVGGWKKTYPGQDLQECGQLRQSPDALNCRGTINHWPEGRNLLHSMGFMSLMVILFQRARQQSIKSFSKPLAARGSECNTDQWERKALWLVLDDKSACVPVWIRLSSLLGGLEGSSKHSIAAVNVWSEGRTHLFYGLKVSHVPIY